MHPRALYPLALYAAVGTMTLLACEQGASNSPKKATGSGTDSSSATGTSSDATVNQSPGLQQPQQQPGSAPGVSPQPGATVFPGLTPGGTTTPQTPSPAAPLPGPTPGGTTAFDLCGSVNGNATIQGLAPQAASYMCSGNSLSQLESASMMYRGSGNVNVSLATTDSGNTTNAQIATSALMPTVPLAYFNMEELEEVNPNSYKNTYEYDTAITYSPSSVDTANPPAWVKYNFIRQPSQDEAEVNYDGESHFIVLSPNVAYAIVSRLDVSHNTLLSMQSLTVISLSGGSSQVLTTSINSYDNHGNPASLKERVLTDTAAQVQRDYRNSGKAP